MKNRISLLLAFIVLAPFLFLFGTCEDSIGLHPLIGVEIPEYVDKDYLELLKSDNPELVYNAICYLIPNARRYAEVISNDTLPVDNDVNSSDSSHIKDVKLAKEVYTLMSDQLKSENEWILCGALRFFSGFAYGYKKPEELIEKLKHVNLSSRSVRMEYIDAVYPFRHDDLSSLNDVTSKFYEYPSWLESRMAFYILPFVNFDMFFDTYSVKFNSLPEYDKLLFLSGIKRDKDSQEFLVYDNEVLGFVLNAFDEEKSDKVRFVLFTCLRHTPDQERVLQWLKLNHSKLKGISSSVFNYLTWADDSLCSKMFKQLLSQDYFPEELICNENSDLFSRYYSSLEYDGSDQKAYKYPKELMSYVLSYPEYKRCWEAYLADAEKSKPDPRFVAEQNILLENLRKQTMILFDKYNMDSTYRVKYLDKIDYLKSTF